MHEICGIDRLCSIPYHVLLTVSHLSAKNVSKSTKCETYKSANNIYNQQINILNVQIYMYI